MVFPILIYVISVISSYTQTVTHKLSPIYNITHITPWGKPHTHTHTKAIWKCVRAKYKSQLYHHVFKKLRIHRLQLVNILTSNLKNILKNLL